MHIYVLESMSGLVKIPNRWHWHSISELTYVECVHQIETTILETSIRSSYDTVLLSIWDFKKQFNSIFGVIILFKKKTIKFYKNEYIIEPSNYKACILLSY